MTSIHVRGNLSKNKMAFGYFSQWMIPWDKAPHDKTKKFSLVLYVIGEARGRGHNWNKGSHEEEPNARHAF
jgi:hypothetical protein